MPKRNLLPKVNLARLFYLSLCLALFGTIAAATDIDSSPRYQILQTVRIMNDHAKEILRCQLVFAHFVTYDLNVIEPGEEISISIILRLPDYTLLHNASGKAMAIEDLFCGLDSNWSLTRQKLSLMLMRSAESLSVNFQCGLDDKLLCVAGEHDNRAL